MRNVTLFFASLFALSLWQAQGQIICEINNFDYAGNSPANYYWVVMGPVGYVDPTAMKTSHLYTAQEMISNGAPVGGGKIPALLLYQYMYMYQVGYVQNFSIKIAHTTDGDLYSGNPTVFDETEVMFRSSWTIPNPNYSWYRYDFDQPFVWNGTDNIVVTFCHNSPHLVPYGNYLHALQTRYGYSSYPMTYQQSEYKTFYQYNLSNYYASPPSAAPSDWCSNVSGAYNYGPYITYQRADIRLEICNEAPLVYDMTVPALHYLPGTVPVTWSVGRTMASFTATVTLNLFTPGGQLVKSESFQVPINADMKNGVHQYTMAGVPPGYYRLEAVFNGYDECGNLEDHFVNRAIMILEPGSIPCEVWPGDVNNNGVVNYGDRADLNTYIHDANLSPLWLQGPARYRVDIDVNPLTYYSWEVQPAVPWYTPEGCYMDSDGNGMINNFDYIAVKLNWMRTHGLNPKADADVVSAYSFSMEQNYPNPFNPSTSIAYNLPERSQVRLVVSDMLGRQVATLVDGTIEAGSHVADFDASQLSSGNYIAHVQMTGLETGGSYTRTVKMTLGK